MSDHYQILTFYSPLADSVIARISMVDDQGSEFFAHVPVTTGQQWRDARDTAVEAIASAIYGGAAPGEVRYQ